MMPPDAYAAAIAARMARLRRTHGPQRPGRPDHKRSPVMRHPRTVHLDPRTERLGGLTTHLLVFVVVNAAVAITAGFDPAAGHAWGWGLGVAAHALAVLGHNATRLRRPSPGQLPPCPERGQTPTRR